MKLIQQEILGVNKEEQKVQSTEANIDQTPEKKQENLNSEEVDIDGTANTANDSVKILMSEAKMGSEDEGEAYEDKKLPDMKKMKLKMDVESNQKFVISTKKDTQERD